MSNRYYLIRRDRQNAEEYWFLSAPKKGDGTFWDDVWEFSMGQRAPARSERVTFEVSRQGKKCDFNFGTYGDVVILPSVVDVISEVAGDDIQLIPAETKTGEPLIVLNPIRLVDCLDHDRSEITYGDDGCPSMILALCIDVRKVNAKVFRIKDWAVNGVAIDEQVYTRLIRSGVTGLAYQELC